MKSLPLLVIMITVATRAVAQERFASELDGSSSRATARTLSLEIAPHIFDELDALADTLHVETVRCLIGTVEGDRAIIDLAWQPPIQFSSAKAVGYQSCPRATIAVWHNHPELPRVDAEYACYLSRIDIQEASDPRAPVAQIVQVNSQVACWWSKAQVLRAVDQSILWPLESQRRGRHVTLADACRRWGTLSPCILVGSVAVARKQ
jgi:hypothetical protein